MANELEFDERAAKKYLANLESEYEGLGATLKMVRVVIGAKNVLRQMEGSKNKLEGELGKYNDLVEIARKDAEEMEKDSLGRIMKAETRVQVKELEIGSAIAALEDRRSLAEAECSNKCDIYEGEVRSKEKEAEDRVKEANEAEADATNRRAIAEDKLREAAEAIGGVR